MSASRTLCLRCASQFNQVAYAATRRQRRGALPSASFSTATGATEAPGPTKTAASTDGIDSRDQRHHSALTGKKTPNPSLAQQHKQRLPKKRRSTQLKPADHNGDDALALFNDIVGKKKTAISSDTATATASPDASLVGYEIAGKLMELKVKDLTAAEQYTAFQDIWPYIEAHPRPLPKHLYTLTLDYITKLSGLVVKEGYVRNGVCMDIIKKYHALRKWNLVVKNDLVLTLCLAIIREKDAVQREKLAAELVDVWKAVSQMRRPSQRGLPLQFALPKPDEVLKDIDAFHRKKVHWKVVPDDDTSRALASILIQFDALEAQSMVPSLLATVTVLTSAELVSATALNEAAPLLELVPVALQRGTVNADYIDSILADVEGDAGRLATLRTWVHEKWPNTMTVLSLKDAAWRTALHQPAKRIKSPAKTLAQFHKQLRTASHTNNIGAILAIWQDLKTAVAEHPDLIHELRQDAEFFDFWQYVWCSVRRPTKLQETQALMQEVGLQPTVKTYTAMMHGWKAGKDLDKIRALWTLLAESDLKLDKHIWTERISALIELGPVEAGLHALAEMMNTWEKASKPTSGKAERDYAVQPTIEVVNAAFNGLIRQDRRAALEVLDWAGRHGIQPDTFTYNILIRESLRSREPSTSPMPPSSLDDGGVFDMVADGDAQSLLRSMKQRGIEPNEATFTIILEEVLGVLAHATVAEQVEAVQHVMSDLAAAGVQPNLETYGKMLHAVAILPNSADEAIEAVLTHMRKNGHTQITPHMVLILINRVLRRIEAGHGGKASSTSIVSLLNRHGFSSIRTGDQRLWENVLSAYAATGDGVRAMALHDEMRGAGRPITRLPCLRDLLVSLLDLHQQQRGEWYITAAQKVVDNAMTAILEREEDHRDSDRQWRHHFWHLAHAHGLVDKANAPLGLRRALEDGR